MQIRRPLAFATVNANADGTWSTPISLSKDATLTVDERPVAVVLDANSSAFRGALPAGVALPGL